MSSAWQSMGRKAPVEVANRLLSATSQKLDELRSDQPYVVCHTITLSILAGRRLMPSARITS